MDSGKKKVFIQPYLEFVEHGLPYVFPIKPGTIVTGLATAILHPYFAKQFSNSYKYVWPADMGVPIVELKYKVLIYCLKPLTSFAAAMNMWAQGKIRLWRMVAILILVNVGKHVLCPGLAANLVELSVFPTFVNLCVMAVPQIYTKISQGYTKL